MSIASPILELRDVTGEFPADGEAFAAAWWISLSVRAGEMLAVVGESGSSKTVTALSILGLIEAPGRIAEGEIRSKGNGIAHLLHKPESYFRRLRARAVAIFPELVDARWEAAWGGRFALTVDHLPHVHMPGNGLLVAIGCNGRGVAMMSQLGSMLADLATGTLTKDDALVPVTPLRPVPLHALRRLGLEAFTLWYRLLDALPRA